MDQSTKLALMDGMWTTPNVTILPVSPVCSTANCTFQVYNSLAICSSVANVTDFLAVEVTSDGDFTQSKMTLPNGIWFIPMAGGSTLSIQTQTKMGTSRNTGYFTEVPYPVNSTSLAFANLSDIQDSAILDFFVLYNKDLYEETPFTPAYRAIEVLFYWCINSYSTSVTAGIVTTEIVTSSNSVLSHGDPISLSPIVLSSGNDTINYTVGLFPADVMTFDWLPILGTGSYSQTGQGFTSQGAEVFSYALHPAGIGDAIKTAAELANSDAISWQVVLNLTNNIATSLTNM